MGRAQDLLDGNGYVLVLDKHVNRSMLVKTVVERMGYKAILYKNGSRAMSAFRLQPEKFSLVLVHHDSVSSEPGSFVDQLLKIDPKVPVVIDTGYQNPTVKKRYLTRFSNVPSIFIRPVMLKELSKTIQALVQPNA